MSNFGDNISFFLEDKTQDIDNSIEIEKMLHELEDDVMCYDLMTNIETNTYYLTKKIYDDKYGINNEQFYQEYPVKQLLRICNYYDIEKNVKMAKYKKQDIISSIVYFESLPENVEIVNNRHRMWSYITELMQDSKMKKYVIW